MKRSSLLICVVLLVGLAAGPALWAQSAASGSDGSTAGPAPAPGAAGASQGSGTGAQGAGAAAAGSDENDFFGSGAVEAQQGAAETKNPAEAVESEKLGFSGQFQSLSSYEMTRNFVQGNTGFNDNTFANTMMGDFLVDARLPRSFRLFLDMNINYVPTGVPVPTTFIGAPSPLPSPLTLDENETTLLDLKEVFVDFNFANNAIHFRAGKQVLQWGTGYFWNPTDLINVSHKSFTNLNALLDGVFGLRTDVTFSSAFHLYTFINLNGVSDLTYAAYAARTEFLVGKVEFGFSGWYEYNKIPVFGTDITTPLFWELNMTGEASVSYGDNVQKVDANGNPYSVSNQLVPKVDIGLSRTFDVLNVVDRLSVMTEFFWNSDGYNQDMFTLNNTIPLQSGMTALQTFLSGYYHASYYGQYYGALFVSIADFGLPNMTLSLDGLMNFSDSSAIALVGLSDSPVNNFTLEVQLGSFLGPNNSEYTISENPSTGTLTNNMLFVILSAQVNF
jgi:hypothetical protein